jgi:glycosyltransferase involved in cell wall biosynthesis
MSPIVSTRPRRVLILVENLPVPFDRRVWAEATALQRNGYEVSVICPKMMGYTASHEVIDGIAIYRHSLPLEAHGKLGFVAEYGAAVFWEFVLAWKVFATRGFDAIHLCNPPDLLFLVGGFFKLLFRKKVVFDQHDICPEVFEAKFNKRGLLWRVMVWAEWLTFRTADISIATNESYRRIALTRGGMKDEDVFVVRSGPNVSRLRQVPPNPALKKGRRYLVGYVGVMGQQEGIDLLLETAQHLLALRPQDDVQFVLVGGGPSLAEMRALSEQMGLADRVTFTGRVDDQTLFEVLSTADVCANPDRPNPFNDMSTMNKIMEYMAFGKPIVQFDLKEGRFSAQEASLYARDPRHFAELINQLLDDPEARERMGAFGQRRLREELAWDKEEPKLLAAYERLFTR